MKKINFLGWENCIEIESGKARLVVTTEVGPRIIGVFVEGSPNLMCVQEENAGKTGGDEFRLYGGHRLWHSPEDRKRTYCPDNDPVKLKETKDGIRFCSGTEKTTGIHKSICVEPLEGQSFRITHSLRNENLWTVELAAWALSVMAPGGTAVVPQPEGDVDSLLPNRYLSIWPYTDISDPRLVWGRDYVLLKQDSKARARCKFGLNAEDGWIAYVNGGYALKKSFTHLADAEYPDNGCSIETFTCDFMLEIETLSPLYSLEPGGTIVHVEEWELLDGLKDVETEKDAADIFG